MLFLAFLALTVTASISEATTENSIEDFRRTYNDEIYSLLFYEGNPTGNFWQGLSNLFTVQDTESDYEKNVAHFVHMMRVDLSDKNLEQTRTTYAVPKTPYIMTFNGGQLVFEETPDARTEEKI